MSKKRKCEAIYNRVVGEVRGRKHIEFEYKGIKCSAWQRFRKVGCPATQVVWQWCASLMVNGTRVEAGDYWNIATEKMAVTAAMQGAEAIISASAIVAERDARAALDAEKEGM